MKMRNKKTGITGKLTNIDLDIYEDGIEIYISILLDNSGGECIDKQFHSIDELKKFLKDWEDVKEPLIKDEKVRKVFREWADLFGAEQFRVNHFSDSRRKTTSIGSTDSVTEPVIELPGHIGEDSEIYTKEELCGEEEE